MSTFALGFNSICEMDYLPKDPAILVSSVNMLLRDEEFDTLEALCFAFSRDPKEIKDYLYRKSFVWSEQQKQFRPLRRGNGRMGLVVLLQQEGGWII